MFRAAARARDPAAARYFTPPRAAGYHRGMKKAKPKGEKLSPIPKPGKRRAVPQADRDGAGFSAVPDSGPDLSHITPSLRPMTVSLADLAFLADNPVEHPESQLEDLRGALRSFGQVEPIIVNRRPSPPEVIGGNGRLAAMLSLGWTHAAAVGVDLPADQAKLLAVTLNRTADGRKWKKDTLARIMAGVRADNAAGRLLEDPGLRAMMDGLQKELKPRVKPKADESGDKAEADRLATQVRLAVLVDCRDPEHQGKLVADLRAAGETCRPATVTDGVKLSSAA